MSFLFEIEIVCIVGVNFIGFFFVLVKVEGKGNLDNRFEFEY